MNTMLRKAFGFGAVATFAMVLQAGAAYAGIWQGNTGSGEQAILKLCTEATMKDEGIDAATARRVCQCGIGELRKKLSGKDYQVIMQLLGIVASDASDDVKRQRLQDYLTSLNLTPEEGQAFLQRMGSIMDNLDSIDEVCKP